MLLEPITPVPTTNSSSKSKKNKGKGEDSHHKESQGNRDGSLTGISADVPLPTSKTQLSGSPPKKPTILSRGAFPQTPERLKQRHAPASEPPVHQHSFQPVLQPIGFTAPTGYLFTNNTMYAGPNVLPYVVNPEFYGLTTPRQPVTPLPAHKQASAAAKPFTIRHGTDRHEHFFLELLKHFPQEKKWLLAPAVASNHTAHPEGIHVFVDASNIFVGFYEHLKKLFGLRQGRIEGLQISFDALVLLLERRRPVAKRVVVGSDARLRAFETAKAIGYETSILEQVYKDQELSKHQKKLYYQHHAAATSSSSGGGGGGSGGYAHASQGPETVADAWAAAAAAAAGGGNSSSSSGGGGSSSNRQRHHHQQQRPPSPARAGDPQKWVEQGVDELIHLKMLESIVDAPKPGTMVVATGDAAVAEYSQGFLKMVERALGKGWSVELVAWSEAIGRAYREKAFRARWGDRFRIVELDEFVEVLVDT
jgi:hypothetical protein